MVIEIDNSNCEANINWINVSVTNVVSMKASGHSTSDNKTIFQKQTNGVPARLSAKVSYFYNIGRTSYPIIICTKL